MIRRAGPVAAALAAALLAGCGDGGNPSDAWRERCADTADRLAALPERGPRATIGLAAGAAAQNLRELAVGLEDLDPPGDPASAVNLRNGAASVAVGFANVEAAIRAIGTGGQDRVARDVAVAYDRIDEAARILGLPECNAQRLGRQRFIAYAAVAEGGNRSEPLAVVLRRACARIREAYGPTATPVDAGAALTQLRRSRDVLADIRRDLRGRSDGPSARVSAATLRAAVLLSRAERRVVAGGEPSRVTLSAFDAAAPGLRNAFARAGVPCSALG